MKITDDDFDENLELVEDTIVKPRRYKMDEKVDVIMGREVIVDEYVVSIGLNLNYVPAQWQFQLLTNDPHRGRLWIQRQQDNGVLVLRAPIDRDEKRQIHEWLKSFDVVKLPHWTLFRDIVKMIAELKAEEDKAREGHEFVKQIMAKKKAEQEPPQ